MYIKTKVLTWLKNRSLQIFLVIAFLSTVVIAVSKTSYFAANEFPLAHIMPSGAITYIQSPNLSMLLKQWNNSQTKQRYFASKSYEAFTRSRLYIKLEERIAEFEKGLGFELTQDKISNVVGKESAIALYDMGKLELVYCTEMPTAQAIATILFQQTQRFEKRQVNNLEYYIQDLSTDGGRLRQGLCFAAVKGKLIIATTEPLMRRSLENFANESNTDNLITNINSTLETINGFTSHDLTLWVNVPKLREQRFFGLYWIQGEKTLSEEVASTLADLEFLPSGIKEHRWTQLASTTQKTLTEKLLISELLRFIPETTQAVDIRTNPTTQTQLITTLVSNTIFPKNIFSMTSSGNTPPLEITDETNSTKTYSRYNILDAKFDKDIDDPSVLAANTKEAQLIKQKEQKKFEQTLEEQIKQWDVVGFANVNNATTNYPFVKLDRGIILKTQSQINKIAFETLLTATLSERLIVKGSSQPISWHNLSNEIRTPVAGIVEQGGAYAVVDNYIIIASNPEYCTSLVNQYKANTLPSITPKMEEVSRFAYVKLSLASKPYRSLMNHLEYIPTNNLENISEESEENSSSQPIPFCSANLGSLLETVDYVDNIVIESKQHSKLVEENLNYTYKK